MQELKLGCSSHGTSLNISSFRINYLLVFAAKTFLKPLVLFIYIKLSTRLSTLGTLEFLFETTFYIKKVSILCVGCNLMWINNV